MVSCITSSVAHCFVWILSHSFLQHFVFWCTNLLLMWSFAHYWWNVSSGSEEDRPTMHLLCNEWICLCGLLNVVMRGSLKVHFSLSSGLWLGHSKITFFCHSHVDSLVIPTNWLNTYSSASWSCVDSFHSPHPNAKRPLVHIWADLNPNYMSPTLHSLPPGQKAILILEEYKDNLRLERPQVTKKYKCSRFMEQLC